MTTDNSPALAFSFKRLERGHPGDSVALAEVLARLHYNSDGLIPAIAQQYDSGKVLMLAWMNRQAIEETLRSGRVCYWSRSRQSYWRKGESSGHIQMLVEMRIDCDGDTLLLQVDQKGPACHTGRNRCFYLKVDHDSVAITDAAVVDPDTLYGK